MGKSITDIFVGFLYSLGQSKLSPSVLDQARLCLLDYYGATVAGGELIKDYVSRFIREVNPQGGNVSIVGRNEKTTLHNAAFLNAMMAHVAELDDGHRQGQIHLGASIISALLPVAEIEGLSEDDVLRGIVIGYEAAIRLSMAMNPSHKLRGYHTSGTCGAIGVSMAIAASLRFSLLQTKTALSAATASAAGLLEMQEDGSGLKPYNLAQAAVGGITAAYCGLSGINGPCDAIGGKRGMLAVMTENPNLEYLTSFPEEYYQIETIYRKPYAACRHAHSAIDAVLRIRQHYTVEINRITSIVVETYGMAIKGHDHREIKGISSAKMSIPFCVAMALIKGDVGLKDFSAEGIKDSAILQLASKVSLKEDVEISSWLPKKRAARVIVNIEGGESYNCLVEYPKGEPENPMSEQDIKLKYI